MELWKHQTEAIGLMHDSMLKGYALFMEAGTGKTACVITYLGDVAEKLKGGLKYPKTLIFAPIVVCQNWQDEFVKIEGAYVKRQIHVLTGSGAKKEKALLKGDFNILITNYETLLQKKNLARLMAWEPEILVCDESHRLKSPSAKRSKAIIPLANLASRRFLLTGTPVLKDELDLFNQFKVMDGRLGQTFPDKNFFAFRARYFENANAYKNHVDFPDWQIKKESRVEIKAKILDKSFSVKKRDCLDLPSHIKTRINVGMSPSQARAYKDMHDDLIACLPSGELAVSELAITKAMRLQQIVSGFVKDDQANDFEFKDAPRVKALHDLLEDFNKPIIVWAAFKYNYSQIEKICIALKKSYGFVTGAQSIAEKDKVIYDFQNGKLDVLIANQGAGGIGINLTIADTCIYFSRDFSLEKDIQSEARNYRGGSDIHEKVTRIDLVTPGTIDDQVLDALRKKQNVLDFILKNESGKNEKR